MINREEIVDPKPVFEGWGSGYTMLGGKIIKMWWSVPPDYKEIEVVYFNS